MNIYTKKLLIAIFIIATNLSIAPSLKGYSYNIKNNTSMPVEIYITGTDWASISKDNTGNLAVAADGTIDPLGKTRTLQPQGSTTYQFDKEDKRSEICMQDLMIKLQNKPEFVAAIQKGNNSRGCSNQTINILLDEGKPVACYKIPQEPVKRWFKITNATSTPAEMYITAKGWQYVSKGSQGNLAVAQDGKIDKEGKTRTLQPNESSVFSWDDSRMGFCVGSLMVKFQNQADFAAATPKNNDKKGCANQIITLTREGEQPVANYNFIAVEDNLIERASGN